MFRAFFLSRRWAWWAWGLLFVLVLFTVLQTYIGVLINERYKEIFNTYQTKDYVSFVGNFHLTLFDHTLKVPDSTSVPHAWIGAGFHGVWGFAFLAFFSIFIATFSVFIARHYTFRWRQAITFYYLPLYAKIKKDKYEGSSQRLQQDTQQLAAGMYSLGLGGLQAVMNLIAFIPLLWVLGHGVKLWGHEVSGLLVWVALIMSLGGLVITIWVGRKLPQLEYNNQRVEAAYRKKLVYAEDDKSHADEITIKSLFADLRKNYFALFSQFKYFSLWQNFYGQFMILLPLVVVAPNLFFGGLTLGVLTQIIQAFGVVQNAFAFFLDNWTSIVELRATLRRLSEFEQSIGLNK